MDFVLEARIEEFSYPRGARPAIGPIDLRLRRGDFVAVVGPAGAGKTTLCHCLAGVIPHFARGAFRGSVKLKGRDLAESRLPEIAPLVGFVQQQPENQLFSLTAEEDVAFGPENLCVDPVEIRRRVEEGLASVGLSGFAKRASGSLSGGEAQRLVLASVLAMDPELLVLDQPVAELDSLGRRLVYANLHRLNRERGTSIVLVDDRLDEVLPFLTRVILMLDGRIVRDAPPKEFFADEAIPFHGIRVPRSQEPVAGVAPDSGGSPLENLDRSALDENRPGSGATLGYWSLGPHESAKSLGALVSPCAAEVRDLHFRYPKSERWALQGVSLAFRQGEFTAIIGGNGAGKTTLAKQLAGLLRPTKGSVLIGGRDIRGESTARLSRTVSYLFQNSDCQLFCNSVFDEVAFGLKIMKVPPKRIAELVDAMLQRLGLFSMRDRHPYALNRGQRQLLALASILVREPKALVLDEPSTGLDYLETIQLMQVLGNFRGEGGTVITITHDLDLVLRYADRAIVMARGRVERDIARADLSGYIELTHSL